MVRAHFDREKAGLNEGDYQTKPMPPMPQQVNAPMPDAQDNYMPPQLNPITGNRLEDRINSDHPSLRSTPEPMYQPMDLAA